MCFMATGGISRSYACAWIPKLLEARSLEYTYKVDSALRRPWASRFVMASRDGIHHITEITRTLTPSTVHRLRPSSDPDQGMADDPGLSVCSCTRHLWLTRSNVGEQEGEFAPHFLERFSQTVIFSPFLPHHFDPHDGCIQVLPRIASHAFSSTRARHAYILQDIERDRREIVRNALRETSFALEDEPA